MKRREFIKRAGIGGLGITGAHRMMTNSARGIGTDSSFDFQGDAETMTTREFLRKAVLRKKDVDNFLYINPKQEQWAFFDPELGYRLRNSIVGDGIDGSVSLANFAPAGERMRVNWADKRCRINTYGNSFTQCQQVSDGETWQEYLAAHLGEPVRNFGIGGYGVYQAYRRMLREENTPSAADYIILNIWDDDHFRSIMRYRWIVCGSWRDQLPKNDGKRLREVKNGMLHGNPWAHIKIDPETGDAIEMKNPYPTPESLYKLCDEEHVYEAFKDDLVVQVTMAQRRGRFDNPEKIEPLCRTLGIPGDPDNPDECREIASRLFLECALRASKYIVRKAEEFAARKNKKLMILLSYGQGNVMKACKKQPRFDRDFVDFLEGRNVPVVDTLKKHAGDFRSFHLSPQEYVKRYYIGHYNPMGNHFFAFAIKDAVVKWLEPKPPAYEMI